MATRSIIGKGQTLPEEVLEHLGVGEGDRVEFLLEADGKVELRPASSSSSIDSVFGMLHRPGMRPVSVEEMDEAIGRHLAEDDERIKKGRKGWA